MAAAGVSDLICNHPEHDAWTARQGEVPSVTDNSQTIRNLHRKCLTVTCLPIYCDSHISVACRSICVNRQGSRHTCTGTHCDLADRHSGTCINTGSLNEPDLCRLQLNRISNHRMAARVEER